MKILTISPDQELSELRRYVLEAAGHEVTMILSEKEALKLARENPEYDVIMICHHVLSATARQIVRMLREGRCHATIIYIVHLYGEWPEVEADRYIAGADGPAALVRVLSETRASA